MYLALATAAGLRALTNEYGPQLAMKSSAPLKGLVSTHI